MPQILSYDNKNILVGNDVLYIVSNEEIEGVPTNVDYCTSIRSVKDFIVGTTLINPTAIVDNCKLTIIDNNGLSKLCNMNDFEIRLFGQASSIFTVDEKLRFRVFKVNGEKGYVDIKEMLKFFNNDNLLGEIPEDISKLSIRLLNDGLNSSILINKFKDWINGDGILDTMGVNDLINIKTVENQINGYISLNDIVKKLFIDTNVSQENIDPDIKLFIQNNASTGHINLNDFISFMSENLNIPSYDKNNEFSENTVLLCKDGDDYGLMNKDQLIFLLFDEQIVEIAENTTLRTGDNNLISFNDVISKVSEDIDELYGDGAPVSDINDGDSLIGSDLDTGNRINISFNTLKEKILSNDTNIPHTDIADTDMFFIKRVDNTNANITYNDLKTKLAQDIYNEIKDQLIQDVLESI